MSFENTLDSVKQHQVPQWYHDAKLGIFIHWGLFSVPGYAPVTASIHDIIEKEGWPAMFSRNPYAEWYLNSLRFENSPTRRYHDQTYGVDFPYDAFAAPFNTAVQQWQPQRWAELFRKVHARYVVLTTKHHDGFLLWKSQFTPAHKPHFYAERDIVGELTDAVRDAGLRMGLYYSGGLDWSFNEERIDDITKVYSTIVQTPEFVQYSVAHWHELIDKYQPDVMWNDIGYPAAADLGELFAYYYNSVAEGVINDRFVQSFAPPEGHGMVPPPVPHFDFRTPEYTSFSTIQQDKWECTRGIGFSFGYNQAEDATSYMSAEQAIHLFVDIVSKNGNLLLNVGPMSNGDIPELQVKCLEGLGQWLDVNGSAIFSTRPWQVAEATTDAGVDVRFTRTDDALYTVLMGTPSSTQVAINGLKLDASASVELLGSTSPIQWQQKEDTAVFTLPDSLPPSAAYTLKIHPHAEWVG